ncbi:MAG: hypothetical protein ACREBO_01445 [Novosphingobium sp.]
MGLWDFFVGSTPAGIVGEATSKTIGGLLDGVANLIQEFHLSPEQELKLKLAIEQQRLEFYKAQTTDIQSARSMQSVTQSIWPGILSLIFLIGFFAGGGYIIAYGLPPTTNEGREIILLFAETLMLGVTSVLGFWLGSSYGSQTKDRLLFNSTPAKKD